MTDLFTYERKIIGKILAYYRKQNNQKLQSFLYNKGKFYNENCVTCNLCKNSEMICSPKTLLKIENGEESIKKECFYHRLCEKFELKFNLNHTMQFKINNYRSLLIENIVNFSKIKLKQLGANIELELQKNSNIIYYTDILLLYLSVINYKLYRKITLDDKTINLYVYLLDVINEMDKKIILLCLFDMSYRVSLDSLNRDKIIELSMPYLDDPLLYKIKMTHISSMNYIDAYEHFHDEEMKIDTLANYQIFTLLQYKAFIYFNSGNFEKSYDLLEESLRVSSIDDFSDYDVLSCYKKLAIICFVLKKYREAIKYFELNLKYENSLGTNYVLLFYSLEVENKSDRILEIINNIKVEEIRNDLEKMLLKYYKMKYEKDFNYKENAKWLEEYITKNIVPLFDEIGLLHRRVFIHDLRKLVKITGQYKNLDTVLNVDFAEIDDI